MRENRPYRALRRDRGIPFRAHTPRLPRLLNVSNVDSVNVVNVEEVNWMLLAGELDLPGLFPRLEALADAPAVFRVDQEGCHPPFTRSELGLFCHEPQPCRGAARYRIQSSIASPGTRS